ncbi:MAG: phospholipase A [Halarcobacter sp.]
MLRITILITLFIINLMAQDTNDILKKAKDLENQGKYKEAMLLYKKLATKDVSLEETIQKDIEDNNISVEAKTIGKTLNKIDDKETYSTVEQILASTFNLFPYKENYFLPISYDTKKRSDRSQNETKFQISVKKPLFQNLFNLKETIYFGYTQTSWWQLYDDSAPFRETNYRPEVFVTIPYGKKDKTSLKGFKFGFLHESNGQGKPKSRSWNRLYLESYFQIGNLFLIPNIWYRLPEDAKTDDNPDIEKYLGYGDFTLVYPYKSQTFKLLLRNNLRFNDNNKGYAQFDWTFPFFNSKNTFGYLQLSSGYGDSLIDYNKEINRISFGISLSR